MLLKSQEHSFNIQDINFDIDFDIQQDVTKKHRITVKLRYENHYFQINDIRSHGIKFVKKNEKKKYYEFLTERYDPLPLANWQQDGFPFDYNSVMLSTFYDNNLKSLDALVQNYDPSEYSILKNSDNSRNVYGAKS